MEPGSVAPGSTFEAIIQCQFSFNLGLIRFNKPLLIPLGYHSLRRKRQEEKDRREGGGHLCTRGCAPLLKLAHFIPRTTARRTAALAHDCRLTEVM